MTLLVLAAGADGASVAGAALAAGLAALDADGEKLLVLRDDRIDAEAFAPLDQEPAVVRAAKTFDRVVSLNAALGWVHPRAFRPRGDSVAVLEETLRREWRLAGSLTVAMDAHDADAERLLWRVFPDAILAVYIAPDGEREGWDAGLAPALVNRVTAVVAVPEVAA